MKPAEHWLMRLQSEGIMQHIVEAIQQDAAKVSGFSDGTEAAARYIEWLAREMGNTEITISNPDWLAQAIRNLKEDAWVGNR
jgi:hypothetical protein